MLLITCQQCQTKYQLDDKKIRQPKFRVRCSKCNHIFTAQKPQQVTSAAAIEKVAPKKTAPSVPPTKKQPQCRVIAICNQKGGVAKTTTTLNLASALAGHNKRILLVDFDIQANLSILLGHKNAPSFFDAIQENKTDLSRFIIDSGHRLHLLPSNAKMSLLAKNHLKEHNFEYILREKLQPIKKNYDYILLDTPPSGDFYTLNSLLTAQVAIIPTQSEYLAMNGVTHIVNMIRLIRNRTQHHLDYRILLTMHNPEDTTSAVIQEKMQQQYKKRLLSTTIPFDKAVKESQIAKQSVSQYAPKSPAGLAYQQLAKMIITNW